jgi:hypothetical protein
LAITPQELRYHSDKGKEDSYEAVLEDSNPDNLIGQYSLSASPGYVKIERTLKKVSPLFGVLNGPLFVPPVHFANQDIGNTQCLGVSLRKYSF